MGWRAGAWKESGPAAVAFQRRAGSSWVQARLRAVARTSLSRAGILRHQSCMQPVLMFKELVHRPSMVHAHSQLWKAPSSACRTMPTWICLGGYLPSAQQQATILATRQQCQAQGHLVHGGRVALQRGGVEEPLAGGTHPAPVAPPAGG